MTRAISSNLRVAASTAVLILVLIISVGVAAAYGAVDIDWRTVLQGWWADPQAWDANERILFLLRIPRVLSACVVGAGLAVCGVVLQTVLRNPLAEPYLLGISAGGSTGAVIVILNGLAISVSLAAFAGGLIALTMTLLLGGLIARFAYERLILAGVAVSALFSAITSLFIFQSSDADSYRQVLHWLLGSLGNSSWNSLALLTVAFVTVFVCTVVFGRGLQALLLSDDEVHSLGMRVGLLRVWFLLLAAFLASVLVSVSGAIGFIGLIVPHIVKRLAPMLSQRVLLTLAALVGAILLVWADLVSRTWMSPEEIPVGITTSLVGAVGFAFVLLRGHRDFNGQK